LLAELRRLDVQVWAEGDRLRLRAAKGVLTPELQQQLTVHKAALLQWLQSTAEASRLELPPIEQLSHHGDPPLSFGQERLWFLHQMDPQGATYNVFYRIPLPGVDPAVLERVLSELIVRHEPLRTIFVAVNGEPCQRVLEPAGAVLQQVDLRDRAAADCDDEAQRIRTAESVYAFDLAAAPPVRFVLLRLPEGRDELLVSQHHIITDGWSLTVLVRELTALYAAFSEGRPSPLAPLRLRYADYAAWQRSALTTEALSPDLDYWKKQLADVPLLQLPTDHPRPATQTFDGAAQVFKLSPLASARLKALARAEGASDYMALLGTFKTLLSIYAGQTDITVGTSNGNRGRVELEDLMGFFVNTQVLRTDLSGDPTFREVLRRVSQVTLDAFAHQDVPFEKLVEQLQPRRSLSRSPLFDVLFILQNMPGSVAAGSAGPVDPDHDPEAMAFATHRGGGEDGRTIVETGVAKFDLTLYAYEARGGFRGTLEYNVHLFDDETIDRLLHHFETLADLVAASPDVPLSRLAAITARDQQRIVESNDTHRALADTFTHVLFEEQAARTPERVAVSMAGSRWTYDQLNRRANMIAHEIHARGIEPGALVGVCVERSPDMLASILGVLKAGGAYVPLDPAFPAERLTYMLEDSRAGLVVTQTSLRSSLPQADGRVLCLDDWTPAAATGVNLDGRTRPADLAYVIYTSGSTGRPKGVGVTQRSLLNLLTGMQALLELEPDDRLLAVTTLSFDIAGMEMFLPLTVGAEVAIASREDASDAARLMARLGETAATAMQATPATWQMLADAGWTPGPGFTLVSGGEPLTRDLAHRLMRDGAHVWNGYGPTETAIYSTAHRVTAGNGPVAIGKPIANTRVYVLDANGRQVPPGVTGELYIGGVGVARGYLDRPDLTADRFSPDPFNGAGERMYRTGDLARWLGDGTLDCLGRIDNQVKIRGFRIELGEIEAVLNEHPRVRQAIAMVREDEPGDKRLVAYVVADGAAPPSAAELRNCAALKLPQYMVPSACVVLGALPLSPNGKVDRAALPAPDGTRQLEGAFVAPRSETEAKIAAVWRELLRVEHVGIRDNFFDLGGHSLLLMRVRARLSEELGPVVSLVDLFQYPTVEALAAFVGGQAAAGDLARHAGARVAHRARPGDRADAIAIIGMAGRFPGAADIEQFWKNIRGGVESIRRFTDEELVHAGVPSSARSAAGYVPARGVLDDADLFDARFFGFTPREAELLDPQQRIFLECAWEAIERSGYDPYTYGGLIGLYAGSSLNSYLRNLLSHPEIASTLEGIQLYLAGDKDHLPTRVSYKLNLRGPSVNVQTSCSTSLVAVHQACRSLANFECDMALAGGVSIGVPLVSGYRFEEGGIVSPDGHCRSFDAEAHGTVPSSGCGVVMLKRLTDAVADGDVIHAVIRGTAINNDGAAKVGYTAPSVQGQSEVIALAHASAHVDPATIGYVEAQGIATALGDPIEFRALNTVFRERTARVGYCAIGALKTNLGHMDAASGVGGLMKTALVVKHGELPPSLHYTQPNPEIDFANSPFFVNTALRAWATPDGQPRRAGVSCFGLGGTNAHAVLEEAPPAPASGPSREWQVLTLSARTRAAVDAMTSRLAAHLAARPEVSLADAAHTLQAGRHGFDVRRALICRDRDEAVTLLRSSDDRRRHDDVTRSERPRVVMMFPGLGTEYVGMGRGLYATEAVYRTAVDACARTLMPLLALDVRSVVNATAAETGRAEAALRQTGVAGAALFVNEYALARLWLSWGVAPDALIGQGVGEYAAACVSGVLGVDDALRLIVLRGRQPEGAPAGATTEVAAGFRAAASGVRLHASRITWISNATGAPVTASDLASGDYWLRHANETAGVTAGLEHLVNDGATVFLEVGPGDTLGSLVGETRAARKAARPVRAIPGVSQAPEDSSDGERVASALAGLWTSGVAIDWRAYRSDENRRKVELPTYPFERERYWIGLRPRAPQPLESTTAPGRRPDVADWFSIPSWRRTMAPRPSARADHRRWLIFVDAIGLGEALAAGLAARGDAVTRIRPGAHFSRDTEASYTIDPRDAAGYDRLVRDLRVTDRLPSDVVHMWSITQEESAKAPAESDDRGFNSLLWLTRALGQHAPEHAVGITTMSSGLYAVTGAEVLSPRRATVLGACRVAASENQRFALRHIDLVASEWIAAVASKVAVLAEDLQARSPENEVAYRGAHRWALGYEPVKLAAIDNPTAGLRDRGVYVVTGGIEGVGLQLARHLARAVGAQLVLSGAHAVPGRDAWRDHLAGHDDTDPISRTIVAIRQLDALAGTEVLLAPAEDAQQMRDVVAMTLARFGRIDGVIHAAAASSEASNELTQPGSVLRTCVDGAQVLVNALDGTSLDFVVFCSSVTSLTGRGTAAAASALGAYLDAVAAEWRQRTGLNVTAINWDAWQAASVTAPHPAEATPDNLIATHDGIDAFGRILARAASAQIVVSPLAFPPPRGSAAAPAAPAAVGEAGTSVGGRARPDLQTAYAAPRNEIEVRMAEAWQQLFGLDRIGVDDDFFELGGHSLLATQLTSRLRVEFDINLPLDAIFQAPTIGALSESVLAQLLEEDEAADLSILQEVERLTADELSHELSLLAGEPSFRRSTS
jgi:amino acid adenylation domain-containing protein